MENNCVIKPCILSMSMCCPVKCHTHPQTHARTILLASYPLTAFPQREGKGILRTRAQSRPVPTFQTWILWLEGLFQLLPAYELILPSRRTLPFLISCEYLLLIRHQAYSNLVSLDTAPLASSLLYFFSNFCQNKSEHKPTSSHQLGLEGEPRHNDDIRPGRRWGSWGGQHFYVVFIKMAH